MADRDPDTPVPRSDVGVVGLFVLGGVFGVVGYPTFSYLTIALGLGLLAVWSASDARTQRASAGRLTPGVGAKALLAMAAALAALPLVAIATGIVSADVLTRLPG
jgi:hypothetical protein